ncbi:hypothetical protein BV25DRAFT_1920093 [Artomyces pyxidatus]|uniref:Uncharacterized protein n=1 Tax=Artomyces pyxidatus TaxID=48021 RepID=A0ACB8SNP7_9AGAM|nr:hypothetical protein BV25DRAFT_1920093 [Artomyces pyxidatus]
MQATEQSGWEAADLDVYAPPSTAGDFVRELEDLLQFVQLPELVDTVGVRSKYNPSVCFVQPLLSPSGRRLDVIICKRPSTLQPITATWSTLLTNFMTADTLCIVYPGLTLRGVGCIASWTASGAKHKSDHPLSPYCPHTTRNFEDEGCLRFTFNPVGAEEDSRIFPTLLPFWSLGGAVCGGGCSALTKHARGTLITDYD